MLFFLQILQARYPEGSWTKAWYITTKTTKGDRSKDRVLDLLHLLHSQTRIVAEKLKKTNWLLDDRWVFFPKTGVDSSPTLTIFIDSTLLHLYALTSATQDSLEETPQDKQCWVLMFVTTSCVPQWQGCRYWMLLKIYVKITCWTLLYELRQLPLTKTHIIYLLRDKAEGSKLSGDGVSGVSCFTKI